VEIQVGRRSEIAQMSNLSSRERNLAIHPYNSMGGFPSRFDNCTIRRIWIVDMAGVGWHLNAESFQFVDRLFFAKMGKWECGVEFLQCRVGYLRSDDV